MYEFLGEMPPKIGERTVVLCMALRRCGVPEAAKSRGWVQVSAALHCAPMMHRPMHCTYHIPYSRREGTLRGRGGDEWLWPAVVWREL